MFSFTKEILNGVTYLTAKNDRGTTTMIFEMCGTVFIQVNRSAPKALEDIKKKSKQVVELLSVFYSQAKNERYEVFLKEFGKQKNYVYLAFISKMKSMYCGCVFTSISNHDEFTLFIKKNVGKVIISDIK